MPEARPLKPSVTLVHTTFADLVQIQAMEQPPVNGAGAPLELRVGEVVQCLRNDEHGVLIARADGNRVLVPLRSARRVAIRWFPESMETDDPEDTSSALGESGVNGGARRWSLRSYPNRTGGADGPVNRGGPVVAPRPQ